eukprot:COSAG06_NODE_22093_length_734_cov_1.083465_2_plen_174_part_01
MPFPLCCLLVVTLLAALVAPHGAQAQDDDVGACAYDLTGDGAISTNDLLMILALFGRQSTTSTTVVAADVSGDGIVGTSDLLGLSAGCLWALLWRGAHGTQGRGRGIRGGHRRPVHDTGGSLVGHLLRWWRSVGHRVWPNSYSLRNIIASCELPPNPMVFIYHGERYYRSEPRV